METKKWYLSRTLWLNVLGIIAVIIQSEQGRAWIDPGTQILILAVLNAVVRLLTNQPIGK